VAGRWFPPSIKLKINLSQPTIQTGRDWYKEKVKAKKILKYFKIKVEISSLIYSTWSDDK
jgi:hypothetical protein